MKKLPDLYVQVNLGEEENKGGCLPINSKSFINECKNMGLNISGVMGIPPLGQDPSPYFALLKKIANEASVQKVSMGMTNDFETAVYMGANYLRIGKGIFGERDG